MNQAESNAVACRVCGRSNPRDALFCNACIAPLRVAPLTDFDADDLGQMLDDLLSVLAEASHVDATPLANDEVELLRAYLSAFWLRPETALVQFAEARLLLPLLRSAPRPFLDVGCGDGIHTSILHGWRFGIDFDAFADVDVAGADMFASSVSSAAVPIERPGQMIDLGIDIKSTAVERARRLGTFHELRTATAEELPLATGSVGTIYSNVIRDFDDTLPQVLLECARVIQRGGMLVLPAPTENYQETLFYVTRARSTNDAKLAARDLRFDRGRSVFCRQQVPVDVWSTMLDQAEFELEEALPYASTQLMRFWDTGARPFSPALIEWSARQRAAGGLAVAKTGVVGALERLLAPMLSPPARGEIAGFRIIVARRR